MILRGLMLAHAVLTSNNSETETKSKNIHLFSWPEFSTRLVFMGFILLHVGTLTINVL